MTDTGFVARAVVTSAVVALLFSVASCGHAPHKQAVPLKAHSSKSKGHSPAEHITYGIRADQFADDPNALAAEYYRQVNAFWIAGATERAAHADARFAVTNDTYVKNISAPIEEAFVRALFVKDWKSSPKLQEYVTSLLNIGKITRRVRLETYSGGTEDKEPYLRETLVDKVAGAANPLTTSVRWHERDNREMNTAEEVLTGIDPNDERGGETITWVREEGFLKFGGITHYDG